LEAAGKFLRPGQSIHFIYTLGKPGVRAWDLAKPFNSKTINVPVYKILLNRAMETILQPLDLGTDVAVQRLMIYI
jgi:hypothetical protein